MTATTYAPGTLHHVPPGDLLLLRNVRQAAPTDELVASVKAVGILEPVTAVANDDGNLVVRFGHRRVMAALEADLGVIPVYVTGVDDLTGPAEIERIIRQRDENTQRAGLTACDEVGIVEQLTAFGLTAAQIAAQARVKRENVDTALTVSGSKLASKATARYTELTLDQAAAIAEFEDDEDIAKDLILHAVKEPTRFPHTLQRYRDDRERTKAKDAAIAKLTADGVTIINQPGYDSKTKDLDRLVHAVTGKPVTLAQHKKCPGHVAWIGYDGKPVYGCTALAKNGHRDKWGSSSTPAAADMSDAEREKAKAERRLVIENNKAWDSAQTVRRAWLAEFAKRKTPPKGTAVFIAEAIELDLHNLLEYSGNGLAEEWLGVSDCPAAAEGATEGRALHIVLVQVLGRYEKKTDRMDWRRDGGNSQTGRYLQFLQTCEYGLSDVETFALNSRTL